MKTMIQESDINFRNLVFEINDGIYVCDLNGKFIYANYALAIIFGFKRSADIVGRNFEEFLPPENGKELINRFRNLKSGGTDSTVIITEVLSPDDTTTYIEIKPTPFLKDSKLVGNQGVVHDITELKQAENKKMKFLSTHDPQTNLYHRAFFEAEMNRLERGRQFPISIVVVNVRIMNNAGESEDHEDGDKFLKRVAQVLFNTFRGDDIIARIGENDFAVLLPSVNENIVKTIIKRIQSNLSKNNSNESDSALEFHIGPSTTQKGENLASGLKQAESIAHLAKKKNEPT